jgi:hypothetical protein
MTSYKRSLVLPLLSLALLCGALLPIAVFADYSAYGYNCNGYSTNNNYGTPYWNQNCTNNQGTLTVYVQIQNQSTTYQYRAPSDFTIFVSGANPSQQYFQGSQNGTTVHLVGSYNVTVQNPIGYSPSYSVGCNNSVAVGQTQTCVISLIGTNIQYPYYNQPYQYQQQYQQPVTYLANYVPALPNTGFEPMSAATVAFAVVLLIAVGILTYPYVRKAFAVITR